MASLKEKFMTEIGPMRERIQKLNMKQQVFPSNLIANMFAFKEKEYFELETPAAKEPVKVSF